MITRRGCAPRVSSAEFRLANAAWPPHVRGIRMDLERDGNLIEAGVWFLLSAVLFVYARRMPKRVRPTLFFLAITLAVFGGSDLVEARTGAWWKPWWLFVWKAVCVGALAFGFVRYYRLTKQGSVKDAGKVSADP
jgi:hypothetical protein